MENRLKRLFEYQKFAGNSRLSKMLIDAQSYMETELSDNELSLVSAAGDFSGTDNSGVIR